MNHEPQYRGYKPLELIIAFGDWLVGKKTYCVGVIIVVLCVLCVFDVIPESKIAWFIGAMVGLGFITLRVGIKK